MHVVIIGAGVVGVTSAWYLLKDGHEVTVIDREEDAGFGTSFGNAGGVCPGFAGPWAAPGMPLKALKWMFAAQAPLKVRPRASLDQWRWLAEFTRNCTATRFARNKSRMQKVAHFSKACLQELRAETGITYDQKTAGILQTFVTEEEFEGGRRSAAVLEGLGIPHRLLEAGELAAVEPALAANGQSFAGGLHLTTDETGDCHKFCIALSDLCRSAGAEFRYGLQATGFDLASGRVRAVKTTLGPIACDAVVLAGGPWANDLLRPHGLALPIYPVKGYSMTVEIGEADLAPVSSVMDEHSKVMITRLGSRIRAAGVAELAGFDARMPSAVIEALRARVAALFPGAADYARAEFWHGFRPMTPDGPSITRRHGWDNLWVNLGHGSNGWTQACGTGQLLANRMAGRRTPAVEG